MIGRREWLKAVAGSPMAGWLRGWGATDQAIPPDAGALPHYRRAFARLAGLDEADRSLINGNDGARDPAMEGLLRRFAPALDDLLRGASIGHCDWDEVVRPQDIGVGDHDIRNFGLGRIALIRARRLARAGLSAEALDDVFAAASFGRHLGQAGLLISRIYQFSMENQSIAVLASFLPSLASGALASIPARVSHLPPPCSWRTTMRAEARFIASTVEAKLEAAEYPLELETVKDLFLDEEDARTFLDATKGERDRALRMVEGVESYLAGLAEVMVLPMGSFETGLESFKGRSGGINPLAASVLNKADHLRYAADRTELLWSMLLAARTLILDGSDRFRSIVDPFGDGPFLLAEDAHGFEVRSSLRCEGKPPAILRVGPAPA